MSRSARTADGTAARGPDAVLERLGERVRDLRAARGMSRKALAEGAGVSERFLADVETGVGNPSIMLLHRLVEALALPMSELLAEPTVPSEPDLTLAVELLKKLPSSDLEDARRLLEERFSGKSDRAMRRARIALIGLRGAGKSTLGKKLAEKAGLPFVELDRLIERLAGMDIEQIHSLLGQSAYRRHERNALESVVAEHGAGVVLATPGGIVSEVGSYSYLLAHCFTVWIKATPEEHMARVVAQGDLRPMSGNPEAMGDLRRILETREPLYGKADVTIDTSGRSVEEAFQDLGRALPALRD